MARTGQQMTADEFLALPEAPFRYQLIEGELVVNEPTLPHQIAVTNLLVSLKQWINAGHRRGFVSSPADFRFDDRNIYAPDVWWVREERKPRAGDLYLDGLPDLIVEVRSPSTWRYDLGRKRAYYEEAGIAELWLVDTESQLVRVCRRSTDASPTFDVVLELDGDETLTSPLLPDFEMPVGDVFRV